MCRHPRQRRKSTVTRLANAARKASGLGVDVRVEAEGARMCVRACVRACVRGVRACVCVCERERERRVND